jgi:hypothetical protein
MSSRTPAQPAADHEQEDAVAAWLGVHPDFFARHPQLLTRLRLPHATGGAVSLVERQVQVLRDELHRLRTTHEEMIAVARDNEALMQRLHRLTLALLRAHDLQDCADSLLAALREEYQADCVGLKVFADRVRGQSLKDAHLVSREETGLDSLSTLIRHLRPTCGEINARQNLLLFGAPDAAASAVIVALSDGACFGLLAIGSHDPQRFHAGLARNYLQQLSEIAGAALQRHLHPA